MSFGLFTESHRALGILAMCCPRKFYLIVSLIQQPPKGILANHTIEFNRQSSKKRVLTAR